MKIIDNVNQTVKDDLKAGVRNGSKLSIAAACFSIYAYQELKQQLEGIDELRFIFTPPHLSQRKRRRRKENFTSPVFPESVVCTVLSLK